MLSEVLSSLALLRSQLSANGPENIFVTFASALNRYAYFTLTVFFADHPLYFVVFFPSTVAVL